MKAKGIKLSEVIKSLEVLQSLCNTNEICGTCFLYDPDEKGTACFLAKEKLESLADNIEAALENIAQEHACIMPECSDCSICGYGHIKMSSEEGLLSSWRCTYDPEVTKSETAADEDSLADAPGADQDDRSGA